MYMYMINHIQNVISMITNMIMHIDIYMFMHMHIHILMVICIAKVMKYFI